MEDSEFERYVGDQIEQILDFKDSLEAERSETVTLEEAAREWIRRYAEQYRDTYESKSLQEER